MPVERVKETACKKELIITQCENTFLKALFLIHPAFYECECFTLGLFITSTRVSKRLRNQHVFPTNIMNVTFWFYRKVEENRLKLFSYMLHPTLYPLGVEIREFVSQKATRQYEIVFKTSGLDYALIDIQVAIIRLKILLIRI